MDLTAIMGLVGSLKTAGDISKAAIDLRDEQMMRAKIIEMQGAIMSAQASAMTAQLEQVQMLERCRQLEAEIAGMRAWEAERARYTLTEVSNGVFVYLLKPEHANGEPRHCLCTNCFQQGRKAVLQSNLHDERANHDTMKCPSCQASYLADATTPKYPFEQATPSSGVTIAHGFDPYVGY